VTKENTDRVLLLADLSLKIRVRRIGGIENLLGLQNIQLGANTMVKPQPCQLDGVFLCFDCVLGDTQLEVEIEQLKIATGDVAQQGQHHPFAVHPR
jgi:hypothetical protein